MKRYKENHKGKVENYRCDTFIDDLLKVYKKHGLALSHEDNHGLFIIEEISKHNIEHLDYAMIGEEVTT